MTGRTHHVPIVSSGPSGFYAAALLDGASPAPTSRWATGEPFRVVPPGRLAVTLT
jgi:hypothetical protein